MKNEGRNLILNDHRGWFCFNAEIQNTLLAQDQQNCYIIHKSLNKALEKLHS